MSDAAPNDRTLLPLPLDLLREIDERACHFEHAWPTESRLSIESLLAEASANLRAPLLHELLTLEIELRRSAGEAVTAKDYEQRFPSAAALLKRLLSPNAPQSSGGALSSGELATSLHVDQPSPPSTAAHVRSDIEGATIGPFRLERPLGEGGMGTVWVAKQNQPVKRRVALKLIKIGMDSQEVVRRFEQERQALAVLDHPNIARVLDAGLTPDGRPFFAMELVNGLPLSKFCDEARLPMKQRLEIFTQVCMAVQHAHQKGLIHRDLKPANILVTIIDGRPVPKVIDFGVAKALSGKLTEESLETQFGTVIGTLEYMAPEQAGYSGTDIDTRADIYALGVILYELLTGLRPFDSNRFRQAAWDEMIRIIREEEPSKPSTRVSTSDALPSLAAARQCDPRRMSRTLRGDLDWIALKCLEKDRNRRYETANQLALEIQRYLSDEPVQAGPPSAVYRLQKFVRRNRLKVLAASAVLVALVLGLVGSLWQMNRAIIAERDAIEAQGKEAKQRQIAVKKAAEAKLHAERAERNATQAAEGNRQARAALDTITDDVIQNLFSKQPKLGEEERQFLKKVLDHYDQFTKLAGDSPEALHLKIAGHWKIAMMQARLGANADAVLAYKEMRATYQKLLDSQPHSIEHRISVATALRMASWEVGMIGQQAEAERILQESRSLLEAVLREAPKNPDARQWLATVNLDTGTNLQRVGKPVESEAATRKAIEQYRALMKEYPQVIAHQRLLADANMRLVPMLHQLGRSPEALSLTEESLSVLDKIAAVSAEEQKQTHFKTLRLAALRARANILFDMGQTEPAIEAYHAAIATADSFIAERPAEPESHTVSIWCKIGLARCHKKLGQTASEIAAFQAAEQSALRLTENYPDHSEYASALALAQLELAWSYRNSGDNKLAIGAFPRAIETRQAYLAKFADNLTMRYEIPSLYEALGFALSESKDLPGSLAAHQQALDCRKKLATEFPDQPEHRVHVAHSHEFISCVYAELKQFDAAASERELAVQGFEELAKASPDDVQYLNNIVQIRYRAGGQLNNHGETLDAINNYRQAYEILEVLLSKNPDSPVERDQLAWTYRNMGAILLSKDLFEVGLTSYLRAITVLQAKPVLDVSHATFRADCAHAIDQFCEYKLRARGRATPALLGFRAALEIRKEMVADFPERGDYPLHVGWSRHNIGIALLDRSQLDAALEEFGEIKVLLQQHAKQFPNDTTNRQAFTDLHAKVGNLLLERGHWIAAEENYRTGLQIVEQVRQEFPQEQLYKQQEAWCHANIAAAMLAQGQRKEAIREAHVAYELFDRWMCDVRPDRANCSTYDRFVLRCCEYLDNANEPNETAKIVTRYVACVAKTRPPEIVAHSTILSRGGMAQLKLKEYVAAEQLLRPCLAIREKYEASDWQTFNTKSFLGEALLGQKKYEEAAPLLLAGYQGMAARQGIIPENFANRLPEALERLVRLANETDQPEEAKKWQSELNRLHGKASPATSAPGATP